MNPSSASEDLDDSQDQLNLRKMFLIALAAVAGTTLAIWVFHFTHIGTTGAAISKSFPRIAVLPFHSLSASPDDIESDRKLTIALIGGLSRISRVEALPAGIDTDPAAVGRELGVKVLLIGKVERQGSRVRVNVQMVSARDGKQVWTGSFDGDSNDVGLLSAQIDRAVAPHLTALLD